MQLFSSGNKSIQVNCSASFQQAVIQVGPQKEADIIETNNHLFNEWYVYFLKKTQINGQGKL